MTNDPHSEGKLLVAMELSNSKWMLGFTNGQKVRRKSIEARDRGRFLAEVALAKEKLGFEPDAAVLCCYEAGRDGFWIYRWLASEGIDCLVVDPASIEVSRRKRRAKTDRLDVESLVRLLGRYESGETQVWAVVRVPGEMQEDELRLHREMERLKKEHGAHSNRIKSLLILHGIKLKASPFHLGKELDGLRCWNGKALPEALREEIRRELVEERRLETSVRLAHPEDQVVWAYKVGF